MNANERKSVTGQATLTGVSARLPRRRFLGLCASLLGALGLFPLAAAGQQAGPALGGDSQPPAQSAGPRERALHEADFYRPHDLAG